MAKVGLLINSLSNGGAERVVSRLSHILSADNEIFLILYDDANISYDYRGELINMGIKPSDRNLLKKALLPFRRSRALKKIKQEKGLDICISFMASPNIVNLLGRTPGCKTAISIRNFTGLELADSFVGKIKGLISRLLYAKADVIIPVSREIRQDIITRYHLDPQKVITIYNPYDIESITRQKQEPLPRDHAAFMEAGPCVISVGRNMHQKGFWHLLKAFSLAKQEIPELRLVIVGRNELPEQMDRLLDSLQLRDSVLLPGFQKNPFAYIERAKVYVLSSLFEGFPNSLAEAMACRKPVIAANCRSGPKEILSLDYEKYTRVTDVCPADFGILVPEMGQEENWDGSVTEPCDRILARAIADLIAHPDIQEKYAEKALQRAQDFTFKACGQQYQAIIDQK